MRTHLKILFPIIVITIVLAVLIRVGIPQISTNIPLISSWIDVILAIEFGIPVITEFYSRFLSNPNWK